MRPAPSHPLAQAPRAVHRCRRRGTSLVGGIKFLVEYRRQHGRDIWHYYTTCLRWPRAGTATETRLVIEGGEPMGGELCKECKTLDRRGECKKLAHRMEPFR